MVMELVELGLIAKYEDLKDILERSASSAERYIKQSIESGFLKESVWREWKQKAKNGHLSRQERIEKGRDYVQNHFRVLVNESGRGEGIWLKGITSVIQKILIFSRGLRLPGGTSG